MFVTTKHVFCREKKEEKKEKKEEKKGMLVAFVATKVFVATKTSFVATNTWILVAASASDKQVTSS